MPRKRTPCRQARQRHNLHFRDAKVTKSSLCETKLKCQGRSAISLLLFGRLCRTRLMRRETQAARALLKRGHRFIPENPNEAQTSFGAAEEATRQLPETRVTYGQRKEFEKTKVLRSCLQTFRQRVLPENAACGFSVHVQVVGAFEPQMRIARHLKVQYAERKDRGSRPCTDR